MEQERGRVQSKASRPQRSQARSEHRSEQTPGFQSSWASRPKVLPMQVARRLGMYPALRGQVMILRWLKR